MTHNQTILKLFVGFPLIGELKSALRKNNGWESAFLLVKIDHHDYIGQYIQKEIIDPLEVEKLAHRLEEKLRDLYPEIALNLPEIQIFPQVFIP